MKVVRTKPTAELVRKTVSLMSHGEGAHINMPCAPMPIPDMDDTSLMHPALVAELTGSKPYYRQGGDSSFVQTGILLEEHMLSDS